MNYHNPADSGDQRHVLIIDDNPQDCYIFQRHLQSSSPAFRVTDCASGREGLAYLQENKVDCVLVDYHLPDMDGLEALSKIRSKINRSPAVVMLTGSGNEAIAVQAMKNGAQDYLLKDALSARSLRRAIQGAIDKNELQLELIARQQELTEAKQAAEAANSAKGTFLAKMSHELRTPLNAILGFAQLLAADGTLNENQRKDLSTILASGEHLLHLINDVLVMSKIEANRLELRGESFDIVRMLNNLRDILSIRAESKNLIFNFYGVETLPRYIYADVGKLRQILLNLLNNAIKFTDEGGVTLRVRAERATGEMLPDAPADGVLHWLHFEISDSGQGIPPQEAEAIFEAFTQSARRKSIQEGTGLGLPIASSFVELMGGELRMESEVNVGTTFYASVKVSMVEGATLTEEENVQRVAHLAPGQSVPRILVAEDRYDNRRLAVKMMRGVGYHVRTARNGREALDITTTWQPDLILMDADMPGMDGIEATRRIKTSVMPDVCIIALTASAFEYQRAEIIAAGCDDYITKPFRREHLLERVGQFLDIKYEYTHEAQGQENLLDDEAFRDEEIQFLTPDFIDTLRRVTTELDIEAGLRVIEQIQSENVTLASKLDRSLRQYRFEELAKMIEKWERMR